MTIDKTRVGCALAVAMALFTGSVSAQTAVNGPYYATPSWDQTLPAATRFVVLANFNSEAVLDRETGLVWQRVFVNNPTGFEFAFGGCFTAGTGGRAGWRLPTIVEFFSLTDPALRDGTGPNFPVGHPFTNFPTTGVTLFWTSTVYPHSVTPTRYVAGYSANAGHVGYAYAGRTEEAQTAFALCVRGAGDPGPGSR